MHASVMVCFNGFVTDPDISETILCWFSAFAGAAVQLSDSVKAREVTMDNEFTSEWDRIFRSMQD